MQQTKNQSNIKFIDFKPQLMESYFLLFIIHSVTTQQTNYKSELYTLLGESANHYPHLHK